MTMNRLFSLRTVRWVVIAGLVATGWLMGTQALIAHHAGTMFSDEVKEVRHRAARVEIVVHRAQEILPVLSDALERGIVALLEITGRASGRGSDVVKILACHP